MKDKILALIENKPKHFSQIIKRDLDMTSEIKSHSNISSEYLIDHIYSYLSGESNICTSGNIKRVKSIKDGYKFCGKASVCECAKQSVSASVSSAKQQYTDSQISEINARRTNTNLGKYGVSNTGQTLTAKLKHDIFYDNEDNVRNAVAKVKHTKHKKYGDENYNNREQSKQTCIEKYGVDNTYLITESNSNPMLVNLQDKEILSLLYQEKTIIEISEYCNVHIQTVYKWLNYHNIRTPYVSTGEQAVYNYLVNDLNVDPDDIIRNTRKVISKELDLYLPNYDIAIEINGIYWHHEDVDHITKTYHYDKFKECENKGIQLINILSVDWDHNNKKIKRIIAHRIRKSDRKRVYARKCTVQNIKVKETRNILNENHIQGYTTAQIALGLFDDTELIAVMTFSKSRSGIGKERDNCYELVRYATQYDIPGGASKLLSYFRKEYNSDIISYSDNSWSNGNMYRAIGFELEHEQPPSYWYYRPRDTKLMHRYNFTKFKLVEKGYDASKTERQITKEMGLLRYWDAGKRVWILKQ